MNNTRLDTLRHMAAAIGEQQRAYWKFFPQFADILAACRTYSRQQYTNRPQDNV